MTMRLRRSGWRAWPVLTLALLLAACDVSVGSGGLSVGMLSGKATDEWIRTYQLTTGEIEISNVNGLIDVTEGGSVVEVKAERIAKASTDEAARALLEKVEMREDVTANRVRVEAKLPSGLALRQGFEIRFHVRVPPGVAAKMETVNGRISLAGLAGRVEAETTNGGITGRDLTGPIKASTVNGRVELDVRTVAGDGIDLSTVNGGVRLTLPRDAKADIDASCTNGGVRVSDLDIQTTENSRRRVTGRLNGGGPRVRLETTNGGVRLSGR